MTDSNVPALHGDDWDQTREALHAYAKVIGKYRVAYSPRQKHWWHAGLLPSLNGFSTGMLRLGDDVMVLELNMRDSSLDIAFRDNSPCKLTLSGQSNKTLHDTLQNIIASMGIADIDNSVLSDIEYPGYKRKQAEDFSQAIHGISKQLEIFKGEQRNETGPVTLWGHHFDLAMLWFSGRLVPDVDPTDEENADEQVNFGFSTGDSVIPDPYFYITAYPLPEGLNTVKLPEGAYWYSESWNGAVMPYSVLTQVDEGYFYLQGYWRSFLKMAQELMQ